MPGPSLPSVLRPHVGVREPSWSRVRQVVDSNLPSFDESPFALDRDSASRWNLGVTS